MSLPYPSAPSLSPTDPTSSTYSAYPRLHTLPSRVRLPQSTPTASPRDPSADNSSSPTAYFHPLATQPQFVPSRSLHSLFRSTSNTLSSPSYSLPNRFPSSSASAIPHYRHHKSHIIGDLHRARPSALPVPNLQIPSPYPPYTEKVTPSTLHFSHFRHRLSQRPMNSLPSPQPHSPTPPPPTHPPTPPLHSSDANEASHLQLHQENPCHISYNNPAHPSTTAISVFVQTASKEHSSSPQLLPLTRTKCDAHPEQPLEGELQPGQPLREENLAEPPEERPLDQKTIEEQGLEEQQVEAQALEEHQLERRPLEDQPLETQLLGAHPLEEQPLEGQPLEKEPLEEPPLEEPPLEKQTLTEHPITEQHPPASSPTPHLLAAVAAAASDIPRETSRPASPTQLQSHLDVTLSHPQELSHRQLQLQPPIVPSQPYPSSDIESYSLHNPTSYNSGVIEPNLLTSLPIPLSAALESTQATQLPQQTSQLHQNFHAERINAQPLPQYSSPHLLPHSNHIFLRADGNSHIPIPTHYQQDAQIRHYEHLSHHFEQPYSSQPYSSQHTYVRPHLPVYHQQQHSYPYSHPGSSSMAQFSPDIHRTQNTLHSEPKMHTEGRHQPEEQIIFRPSNGPQDLPPSPTSNPPGHPVTVAASVSQRQDSDKEATTYSHLPHVLLNQGQEIGFGQIPQHLPEPGDSTSAHLNHWPPLHTTLVDNIPRQYELSANNDPSQPVEETRIVGPSDQLGMTTNNCLAYSAIPYHRSDLAAPHPPATADIPITHIGIDESRRTYTPSTTQPVLPWSSPPSSIVNGAGYGTQGLNISHTTTGMFVPQVTQSELVNAPTIEHPCFFDVGVSDIQQNGVNNGQLADGRFGVDEIDEMDATTCSRKRELENNDTPKARKRRRSSRSTAPRLPEPASVLVHTPVSLEPDGTETLATAGSSRVVETVAGESTVGVMHSRSFACSGCGEEFGSKRERDAHVRSVHERMFSCSKCSARFKTKSDANRHVRIVHERSRPYPCKLCSSRFSEKNKLRRHQETVHDKLRPYVCPVCFARFGELGNLRQHTGSLHPDVPLDTAQLRTRVIDPPNTQQIQSQ